MEDTVSESVERMKLRDLVEEALRAGGFEPAKSRKMIITHLGFWVHVREDYHASVGLKKPSSRSLDRSEVVAIVTSYFEVLAQLPGYDVALHIDDSCSVSGSHVCILKRP